MINLKQQYKSWLALVAIVVAACSSDPSDDPIPYQQFQDIILNLNLPENLALKSQGGYRAIGGGVRGIIVYCAGPGQYIAYERNCSFQPNDACATVNIAASKLFMEDSCCGSQFDFTNGNPTGGPAWRPLRRYQSFTDGFNLTITDTAID